MQSVFLLDYPRFRYQNVMNVDYGWAGEQSLGPRTDWILTSRPGRDKNELK